jgi:gag-polypeptide of LTR copia-type
VIVMVSCSGIPLGLVQRARGDVRDALRRLDKKYAKRSTANLVSLLNKDFTNCKLQSTTSDPEAWFVKLDRINLKLRSIDPQYEKKPYEIKAHLLLGNLPEGYKDVKTKLQGQEDNLDVEDIEEEISNKWQRTFKKNSDDGKTGGKTNVAMTVEGKSENKKKFTKKFKGRCDRNTKEKRGLINLYSSLRCSR